MMASAILLTCLVSQILLFPAFTSCGTVNKGHSSNETFSAVGPQLPFATRLLLNQTLGALAGESGLPLSNVNATFVTNWDPSHASWKQGLGEVADSASGLGAKLSDALLSSLAMALQRADSLAPGQTLLLADHLEWSSPTAGQEEVRRGEGAPGAGVTVLVYEDFFAKASAVAVQLLKENFRKVQLETLTAVAHVPVLGDFRIKLDQVGLDRLEVDKASTGVSLGTDGTFVLLVSGLTAVVEGHVRWRRTQFPFISGGCQLKVTAEDGNVQLRVRVLEDGEGRPRIDEIRAADVSFGSISFETSQAKLAWLYNAVAVFAHDQIQAAITKQVAKQVETTVPKQLNGLLAGVPTTVQVKGLQLNTSLVRAPRVTTDRLIVWDWGRFKNPAGEKEECPFVKGVGRAAGEEPVMPGGAPYMLVANLDESIANCLTWDLFLQGKLQKFLVGDEVPQQALYTDTWRFVIPAVYARCPGCPMALNASVLAAPHTKFEPVRGISTLGVAKLSFFLADSRSRGTQPDSREERAGGGKGEPEVAVGEHLFTLSLTGQLTVEGLRLEKDEPNRPDGWRINLSMKVNQTALAVDVLESDVGPINKASLHLALTVAAFLVEDQVNHGILKDGFPLPDIPHIKVDRANVTVAPSSLALGSDFSYKS